MTEERKMSHGTVKCKKVSHIIWMAPNIKRDIESVKLLCLFVTLGQGCIFFSIEAHATAIPNNPFQGLSAIGHAQCLHFHFFLLVHVVLLQLMSIFVAWKKGLQILNPCVFWGQNIQNIKHSQYFLRIECLLTNKSYI